MSRIRTSQTQGSANVNSFAFIQPDLGTTPAADSPTDTLTLTSSDNSITITGDATTDTIDLIAVGGGGGVTEYVEDDPSPANPTAPAINFRRRDSLGPETDLDGDWVTGNATNKGEQYVKHVDSIPVTQGGSFTFLAGGGTFTFANAGITVMQGSSPWIVGGTLSIAGGTFTFTNAGITVMQGSSPWIVGGTVSIAGGTFTLSHAGVTAIQGSNPWIVGVRDAVSGSMLTLRTPTANNLTGSSLISAAVLNFNYLFNGSTWDAVSGNSAGLFMQGELAHDSPDTGRPVKIGFQARQTNPTAVADVDRVNGLADDIGRPLFLLGHCRDLINQNQIGISNVTTAHTLIVAGGAGVFHDITSLDISNWSQVSTNVDLLEGTSIMMRFQLAPKQTLLKTFPVSTGWKEVTANTNWFAQLGATAVVSINVQYVKNI